MERKIGEIFEFGGEWYQCVEADNNDCIGCDLKALCPYSKEVSQNTGFCSSKLRNDGKSVILKKLEKVGEPITINGKKYQRYITHTHPYILKEIPMPIDDSIALIEIKQNKEDMEEKKLKISFEKADYLINKLQDILANYLHGGESDEVIAKFEELLDMEEKHSNFEKIGKNLRPFDLEAAKAGKPVCTRDGRKARIICFDRKDIKPIVALVTIVNGTSITEKALYYFEDGHHLSKYDNNINDLMMLPEKKEGWAKIRKDINLYDTKEEADRKMIGNDEYVTAKVFWEE